MPSVEDDDDTCSQTSCARHGNDRECCTPFRNLPVKLDRAMITAAVAAVRPRVLECAAPGGTAQLVRVTVDVGADGSVVRATVLEAPEPSIGECAAEILRGASFRQTSAGTSFVFRIDLSRS